MDAFKEKVYRIVEAMVDPALFDLVDVNVSYGRNANHLQVLIDRVGGGITLEECARFNREIAGALAAQAVPVEDYDVEVSSPGIDRPFSTVKGFLRAKGREVLVFLRSPFEGKIEYRGVVEDVREESVSLKVKDATLVIPFSVINKAKQII